MTSSTRQRPRPEPPARRRAALTLTGLTVVAALTLAACGGGDGDGGDGGDGTDAADSAGAGAGDQAGDGALSVLIATSGDAETDAVTAAAEAWSAESGTSVDVQVAQDMDQQLAQGFAGGSPPDLFYLDAGAFADVASAGNLVAYADQVSTNADVYEPLRDTFTLDGTQYCVPKDFSTLALQIRADAWEDAGLTDEDIPTTWDELTEVAATLTTDDQVGLGIGVTRDRVGAFALQAGGWWVSDDGTEATADSEANVQALVYVQGLLADGSAAFPGELDAGWGGEAFGTGRAAMTIEGNWIRGAMRNDYPDVEYVVAELPAGPAGPGTLLFTQCWGIAADSPNQDTAVELVEYLTSVEQQLAFAEAFGVMPSNSAAEEEYVASFPDDAPFIAGAEYGRGPVTLPEVRPVLDDFDAQLESLATGDPETILGSLQTNLSAVVAQ